MKFAAKSLLLLITLAATYAFAQTANTPIKHVIVVIQENRTPDNLFQDINLVNAGGDIAYHGFGYCHLSGETGHHNHQVTLKALSLASCDNPGHLHPDWQNMYEQGNMDGACNNGTGTTCTTVPYPCPFGDHTKNCSQYTYVENTAQDPVVQPYWDIAEKYGFANYMFQTNQGPSFPAHQFVFGGSSVPVYPSDTHQNNSYFYHDNFVANNPVDPQNTNDKIPGDDTGCITQYSTQSISWIDPGLNNWTPAYPFSYPCYDHATLTDLLDNNQLGWKYYGRAKNTIWEAPTAISHICVPGNGTSPGDICTGTEWRSNFAAVLPPSPPQNDAMAMVLEDIENCNLPAVSWVIPDGSWSDHGGKNSDFKGPFWAAAIVNAVGAGGNCDNPVGYWADTVILVVWDDWGGYYDHVLPWNCNSSGQCTGYPNPSQPDSGRQYVYGFRVPLLVISAYTQPGFISGKCQAVGNCQNEVAPHVHDFGSILNFIEYAFGSGGKNIGVGEIEPSYHYADHWAPDAFPSCPISTCPYSLSDFFGGFATQYQFQQISLPPAFCNNQICYNAEWFENFNGTVTDPDDDAIDP